MPAPHRVLRDSELTATRLVAAVRERVAFDPCASCEPARCRGDARKSTDDDDDGATTELVAPIGSPRRATEARDDWTRAYEAFRASADGKASVRSQFDEVNERLRADLDVISSGATAGDGFASPAVVSAHSQGNSPRAGAGARA